MLKEGQPPAMSGWGWGEEDRREDMQERELSKNKNKCHILASSYKKTAVPLMSTWGSSNDFVPIDSQS